MNPDMNTSTRPGSKQTVLNVDDNEPARYAKTRVLTEGGYAVLDAANGPDALEMAAKHRPDVIVLDVGLPGIDGIEVCRRLKSAPNTAGIPVVQVSASFVKESDRVRALEGGADTYLTEPMEPRVLLATVGAMLRMRRAESALRQSEQRFQMMADASPVMIWLADATGACVWFNSRWYEFTGGTEEDQCGSGWEESVHPEDREHVLGVRSAAYEQRVEYRVEFRLRQHTGEYRWLLDHGVPLYQDKQFNGFIGSSVDITDRKTTEDERAALLRRERAARAESDRAHRIKDEFLATLSHELRTPLSAIIGWTHVLRTCGIDNAQVRDAVERIERNAQTQARIIEDLLDMSRIISGKILLAIEKVDMDKVVSAAVEGITPAAKFAEVMIRIDSDTGDKHVAGDPGRLQQVVGNLLTNAVKFSAAGGTIEIAVSRRDGFVECEVRDHGTGIAPEFLPHVFERFRQADASSSRNHSGLGLGLAIVKHLIELHGGSVEAYSAGLGEGATLRLRLPHWSVQRTGSTRQPVISATSDTATETSDREALRGKRILIVDDDPDARDLLERVMRSYGAEPAMASSAIEGLSRYEEQRPDGIISDIGMPGSDGYDFIRRVREIEHLRDLVLTPAVALTAFARHEDRDRALVAGYQQYVAKPFRPDTLVRLLAAAISSS